MTDSTESSQTTKTHSLGWLMHYALRRWSAMVVVFGAMILKTALDLLKPVPMKILLDHVLKQQPASPVITRLIHFLHGDESRQTMVVWCVAATVVIFIIGWGITAVSAMANVNLGQRLAYDVAGDVFQHLQKLSLRFHARKATGDSIRRVLVDSAAVASIAKDAVLPAISSLFTLVGIFLVLLRLNWTLTLVAVVVVPYLIWVLRRSAGPMMQRSFAQQEIEGRIYTSVEQTLSAVPVIHAFTREDFADELFRGQTDQAFASALRLTRIQIQFKFLVTLATAFGTTGILWLGAHEALQGRFSVGTIVMFLSYLASLYAPLETLAYTSSTLQFALGSAKRVREILDQTPEVREIPSATAIQTARGQVQMQGVNFGYDSDRPILKEISLEAKPGEMIAIVGPTGAGKSTLLGLIPRFFDPWSGAVALDGKNLTELKIADLRKQISMVLQEPFLFPLTIAENIAYGKPEATREQIIAAATAASAHEFVVAMPDGYDTVVGERGATLSGGQRQRISIARALLKNAPILLMDEPTSALDAQTEQDLVIAIGRLVQDKTTFVIAHRLSTIRKANQIVVMDQGQIVERGTHDQLTAAGGLYSRLHQAFSSAASEASK
jgi:ATP-binding cassette subfamily B protein/subfamily B ATP-binding cassette protein MsbA